MLIALLARRLLPFGVASLALASSPMSTSLAPASHDAPRAGSVEPTAPMSAPRAAHTATALADGRVLVAGGFTSEESVAQGAEMYDPGVGRFLPLTRMRTLRHSHTATLLPNGKVLIVGGYAAGSTVIAAAELFDPATNAFTSTGSMRASRAGHVAVLLGNGKVLIAGGIGPEWSFLASAELYDPATGTFAPTSAMTVARESHVAVRLRDGRVLIVGGHRGRRADITLYASAEMFDPANGTFRRAGDMRGSDMRGGDMRGRDMRVRRHKHDAVLLGDGRVLVTGGADERDSEGVYDTTEWFDPASGMFSAGPPMKRPRYKHSGSSVLLPNGVVLIAGGASEAETFDPVTRTFALVDGSARLAGQFSAVAPLAGGRVLVTGGYGNRQGPQASAWLYRP